ncbi:MAG: protein-L-isoaspartate O-methyltransferase [Candidatus Pacebacteria bacterium]|nr:protein-L-isoaspartate O-methyltransferase [Candidatus Paceibacterota bacterium]
MDELIQGMLDSGILHTPRIVDAFRAIDRADFVPDTMRTYAYQDIPLPLGNGQTISQPSTVAFMLELLQPETQNRILDIGSGSGWTTALLGYLTGSEGYVLGLERIPELVTLGCNNLATQQMPWLYIERAGVELGAPERSPFHRILVSAASRTFPIELVSQLTEHGILVIPVRHALWRAERFEHRPIISTYEGYTFVPLITDAS